MEILEIYEETNGIYGYRQMTLAYNRKHKTKYNEKRIRRHMKLLGIKSVTRLKKKTYTKTDPKIIKENLLNRNFKAEKPGEKWLSDVTEFETEEGKVYLSVFFDLYSNLPISWAFSKRNDNNLVFRALDKALEKRPLAKPIVHSDRGYQYTSKGFQYKLELQGMKQSMSRPGKCIDNGPIESFWGKIKSERYNIQKKYKTRKELIEDIEDYLEFYIYERPQKVLKGLTPYEYDLLVA